MSVCLPSNFTETLLREVGGLQPTQYPYVLHFIEALKSQPAIPETMLLSESALSDWDTEEEDVAWTSL